MESPRKFNDCYFYYYSTCTKGDNCVFRHEPSALGCETMCAAWQQGKCLNKRCELRHMELRKNRKQIACYWENQPGGCRKKHCPFMHKNPDARTDGIAPSQPALPVPTQPTVSASEPIPMEPQPMNPGVPPAVAPQPLPLLWQQQRQVLDSALLGVLPPHELLPRRSHEPTPYALPVDPLVVNFDEESDNETPSSTPTKTVSPEEATKVHNKSQEILLLEKIQAEAAAFYSYESLPEPKARVNLSAKYDRLSLDELAGKQAAERRADLDFKVMSLDEIRAKKKTDTIPQPPPITINLNRKRKLSTQEALTTTGNKIIKVIRSNSIVYKQVDKANEGNPKPEQTKLEESTARKRTLSEQCSDIYDFQEAELVDDCHEFKKIKIDEQVSKPRLIRNLSSSSKDNNDSKHEEHDGGNQTDNEADTEVQIVGVSSDVTEIDIIDIDSTKLGEPVDIVDLSEYPDDEVVISDEEITLVNVPDVVASCRKSISRTESAERNLLNDIDSILNDDL